MHLSLAIVDHVIRKLGPVNALVENLGERLLPNKEAHALSPQCGSIVCGDIPCGQGKVYTGLYFNDCYGNTFYLGCGC